MVKYRKKNVESKPEADLFQESQDQVEDNFKNAKGYTNCPYLGLKTDPATKFTYPSNWNICYRSQPQACPAMLHQQDSCLTERYKICPVFLSQNRINLPEDLAQPEFQSTRKMRIIRIIAGAFILLLIFLLGLPYMNNVIAPPITPDKDEGAAFISSPTGTSSVPTLTPSQEKPLITGFPTNIAPTEELATTSNTETIIIRRLDTPIGGELKLVVHQVLTGESLEQYAETYGTTKEAIVKLNYLLPIPLWINWLVVIPVNFQEINDTTTFEGHIITQNQISAEELAEKFAIDLTELRYFNNLSPGQYFYSGDVVVIPREGHFFDN